MTDRTAADPCTATVHGTAVAYERRGVLILGAPGTGKSTLALEMLALGAVLVADDRVDLARAGRNINMSAPAPTAGLVEARGIGLLRVGEQAPAALHLVVDLDRDSPARLPERQDHRLLDVDVPVILGKGRQGLAAILMVLLKGGVVTDPDAGAIT